MVTIENRKEETMDEWERLYVEERLDECVSETGLSKEDAEDALRAAWRLEIHPNVIYEDLDGEKEPLAVKGPKGSYGVV